MKWLCKIGIHRFRETNLYGSLLIPVPMDKCARCGVYRQFNFDGYNYWTQESVEKRIKDQSPKGDQNG